MPSTCIPYVEHMYIHAKPCITWPVALYVLTDTYPRAWRLAYGRRSRRLGITNVLHTHTHSGTPIATRRYIDHIRPVHLIKATTIRPTNGTIQAHTFYGLIYPSKHNNTSKGTYMKAFFKGYEWQTIAFIAGVAAITFIGYTIESNWCAAGFGCH